MEQPDPSDEETLAENAVWGQVSLPCCYACTPQQDILPRKYSMCRAMDSQRPWCFGRTNTGNKEFQRGTKNLKCLQYIHPPYIYPYPQNIHIKNTFRTNEIQYRDPMQSLLDRAMLDKFIRLLEVLKLTEVCLCGTSPHLTHLSLKKKKKR